MNETNATRAAGSSAPACPQCGSVIEAKECHSIAFPGQVFWRWVCNKCGWFDQRHYETHRQCIANSAICSNGNSERGGV